MSKTPTKAKQQEHLKKLRGIERLIADFEKSDADSMTFDRDQMDTIERAVACHDAVISLDMKKRDVTDTNVGKWTPVSEGLPPKPNGEPLYAWTGEDIAVDEYIVMIKGATLPTSLFWTGDEWCDMYSEVGNTYTVTAWHPLPAPYREGDG